MELTISQDAGLSQKPQDMIAPQFRQAQADRAATITRRNTAQAEQADLMKQEQAAVAPKMEEIKQALAVPEPAAPKFERTDNYQRPTVTPQDMQNTFGLLLAASMLFGSTSRQPYYDTMAAMTGAMQGYQMKDEQLVKDSIASFNANSSAIKERNLALKTEYDEAYRKYADKPVRLQQELNIIRSQFDIPSKMKAGEIAAADKEIHELDTFMKGLTDQGIKMDQFKEKLAASRAASGGDGPPDKGVTMLQDPTTGQKYATKGGRTWEVDEEGQWKAINPNQLPKNLTKVGNIGTAGARESVFNQRILQAGNQAAKDLENVAALPITVSSGLFGGRKQGPGLLDATKEVLANKATSQDVQLYMKMATGFQRNLAAIEASGLAPAGSLTHQMDQLIMKEGDTNLTKISSLAQIRQIVEAGMEVMITNPRVSEAEKAKAAEVIKSVQKSVPFTQKDVIKLNASDKNSATLSDFMRESSDHSGGLSPEKKRRLEELRAKSATH